MEIENTSPVNSSASGSAPAKLPGILLVEDHDDTRRAMSRLLTRWGYAVDCAKSVTEALEIASNHPPDILLSDLGLPDGSGTELLIKLRQDHSFHAVAMTGYGMETDIEKTRTAGFDEHLVKPVPMDRLKQILESFRSR